jgi:hypothetical protein
MANRREWSSLTPAYRRRLERAGITPEQFAEGVSRKAARGHAMTPERPQRAFRNPDKFSEYLRRRVQRGKEVPEGMLPPVTSTPARPHATLGPEVGYPGRYTIDTWIFTRSKGGSASGESGTMTHTRAMPNGNVQVVRTVNYDQSQFVSLAREARQRGFQVQVISVPALGVTA